MPCPRYADPFEGRESNQPSPLGRRIFVLPAALYPPIPPQQVVTMQSTFFSDPWPLQTSVVPARTSIRNTARRRPRPLHQLRRDRLRRVPAHPGGGKDHNPTGAAPVSRANHLSTAAPSGHRGCRGRLGSPTQGRAVPPENLSATKRAGSPYAAAACAGIESLAPGGSLTARRRNAASSASGPSTTESGRLSQPPHARSPQPLWPSPPSPGASPARPCPAVLSRTPRVILAAGLAHPASGNLRACVRGPSGARISVSAVGSSRSRRSAASAISLRSTSMSAAPVPHRKALRVAEPVDRVSPIAPRRHVCGLLTTRADVDPEYVRSGGCPTHQSTTLQVHVIRYQIPEFLQLRFAGCGEGRFARAPVEATLSGHP